MNIKEATEKWVNEFNTIPQEILSKLMKVYFESGNMDCYIEELTIFNKEDHGDCGLSSDCDFETRPCDTDLLPMWGWLWNVADSSDEDWIRNNLENCFRTWL